MAQDVPASGCPLYQGSTTASYFWDDGSGINGDTGAPASGLPMQKGLAASPSWPLGTKGYVIYQGRRAEFFIGDRGPGAPSSNGVMLDLDGKTFAELTGGTWNTDTYTVDGVGGLGHIKVEYVITEWGDGPGTKGAPRPFSTGAYAVQDDTPASPPPCPARSAGATASPGASAGVAAAPPGPSFPEAPPDLALTAVIAVFALAAVGVKAKTRPPAVD